MPSFDVRLISASYRKENDDAIVELFGKTPDGVSVVARKMFRPYFYIIEPTPQVMSALQQEPEFLSIEKCTLWYDGKDRQSVKITGRYPWKFGGRGKTKHRGRYESMGAQVVACDIPFHLRFIYDYDLPSCMRITGELETDAKTKGRYSTDIVLNAQKFEEVPPFDVPIKYMAFDIENSIKTGQIFCICCAIRDGEGKDIEYVTLTGPEPDIINGWITTIKEHDPDVLTGFNCFEGDAPILTPTGRVPIKDLKIGDTVYGLNDDNKVTTQKVINTFKRIYNGQFVSLKTADFTSISATSGHPVLTRHRTRRNVHKPRWEKIENLLPGRSTHYHRDDLSMVAKIPSCGHEYKFRELIKWKFTTESVRLLKKQLKYGDVKRVSETLKISVDTLYHPCPSVWKPDILEPISRMDDLKLTKIYPNRNKNVYLDYNEEIGPFDWYVLGMIVTDGTRSSQGVYLTNTNVEEILNPIKDYVKNKWSRYSSLKKCGDKDLTNHKQVYALRVPNVYRDIYDNVGFLHPKEILDISKLANLSEESISWFLAGVFDGDGIFCRNGNQICIASSKPSISKLYSFLLLKLGIRSSVLKNSVYIYGDNVSEKRFMDFIYPKMLHSKKKRFQLKKKRRYLSSVDGNIAWSGIIQRVNDTRKTVVYNIETELHNYIVGTVIVHNCNRYDIPYIIARAAKLGLAKLKKDEESEDARERVTEGIEIGRDGSAPSPHGLESWKLHGRIVTDAWWDVHRDPNLKLKRESLNFVAKELFGESKEDVDSKKIDEEWKKDKERVLSYCRKDAELALRIEENLRVINKALDLALVTRLPLTETYDARTSNLIDSFMIREADRRGIAVPHTRRTLTDEDEEKIEGGYVKLPTAGLYNMVPILDAASMYPSQIIKNNICFTTLDSRGTVISPHDPKVRYLDASVKQGLIPYLLAKWWKDRNEAKKKMKQAKREGKDAEAKYYDGIQSAIKVMMNATYGILASDFYRFTNKDIGATITSFARECITSAAKKLEEEGVEVLYSDTDSVFIKSPYPDDLLKTVQLGNDIAQRYSEKQLSFEFEKVLDPWFTHGAKKRYFGKRVWPPENPIIIDNDKEIIVFAKDKDKITSKLKEFSGEYHPATKHWTFIKSKEPEVRSFLDSLAEENDLLVRGYETRRRDTFDLQTDSLEKLFGMILQRDTDGAAQFALDIVQSVLRSGQSNSVLIEHEKAKIFISIDKLVISKSCQEESMYEHPDRMTNVLVARKLKAMGADFTPGMRVSWIVTNGRVTPMQAEPWIDGRIFKAEPDWNYYADRLAKSLARVTELWGWTEKALLSGRRETVSEKKDTSTQATLF